MAVPDLPGLRAAFKTLTTYGFTANTAPLPEGLPKIIKTLALIYFTEARKMVVMFKKARDSRDRDEQWDFVNKSQDFKQTWMKIYVHINSPEEKLLSWAGETEVGYSDRLLENTIIFFQFECAGALNLPVETDWQSRFRFLRYEPVEPAAAAARLPI
jgi:hypothetical protein